MVDLPKPSTNEDEYFAREDVEKKRKLALEQARQMELAAREEAKKLHWMKCPRCGLDLHTLKRGQVSLDTCFNCKGIWLDEGELEAIVAEGSPQKGSVMRAILNIWNKR